MVPPNFIEMPHEMLAETATLMWYELEKYKSLFGDSKSEKLKTKSKEAEDAGQAEQEATEAQGEPRERSKRKKNVTPHGRKAIKGNFRVVEIRLRPEYIPEGAKLIEEIVSEEIDLIPQEIIIKRTIREKYVLKDESFIVAPLPERAIYKGIAGSMLVSWLIVSKFVDHLPVYRIREILLRQRGIEHLPLSTMYDWIGSAGTKMRKLFEVLRREVTSQSYRQMDETHIKVLLEGQKKKPLMGYFWVCLSIQAKGVIFDYHPTRGNKGVIDLLKDFKGDLQTDGYSVYKEYGKMPGITHYVCWAHARRKFVEALNNDKAKAEEVLNLIGELYAIESTAREQGLSPAQRLKLRKKSSIDILDQIKSLLDQYLPVTTPKSPIGVAVRYSHERWQELINYANTGHVEIDNNLIENKIRPVALGRKNYLFVSSNESARKNGMWYSFAATCKMNDVDFMDWLYFVLPKLHNWTDDRLHELLPANYKNIEGYTPATEATRKLLENIASQQALPIV